MHNLNPPEVLARYMNQGSIDEYIRRKKQLIALCEWEDKQNARFQAYLKRRLKGDDHA